MASSTTMRPGTLPRKPLGRPASAPRGHNCSSLTLAKNLQGATEKSVPRWFCWFVMLAQRFSAQYCRQFVKQCDSRIGHAFHRFRTMRHYPCQVKSFSFPHLFNARTKARLHESHSDTKGHANIAEWPIPDWE